MQIERGPQVNCSELIVRLNTEDRNEARETLASLGIVESLIKNRYGSGVADWDGETAEREQVDLHTLPIEVKKAWDLLDNSPIGEPTQDEIKDAYRVLEENGINFDNGSITFHDKEIDGSTVNYSAWVTKDPFGNSEELVLMYSQHCQEDGFPMLKKISDALGTEVEAHDGGSIGNYEDWMNEDFENIDVEDDSE